MSVLENVYEILETNKKNIEEGKINGIPFPISIFKPIFPVIKQGQYHLVSALTKHSKTQFVNYTFIFHSIFYAFEHPELIRLKVLYFNFEESAEDIMMKFMSYCLYVFSNKKIRISPTFLQSPDKDHLLPDEVLEILKSERYRKILEFFDSHVEFCEERTSVATDIKVKSYAYEHGSATYKTAYYKDKDGSTHETKSVDKYIPTDPEEYVFVVFDHISLLQPVQGQTLLQAIGEVSKRCVYYKNIFKYIPIVIQQQSKELGSLEANKQGKIRASSTFLSDNKSTVNDCTQFWGLTDPVAFEIPEYLGLDLKRLGHNVRVLELGLNRGGEGNKVVSLYFDGAVNYFAPMPLPQEKEKLERIYRHIEHLKELDKPKQERESVSFFIHSLKKKFTCLS